MWKLERTLPTIREKVATWFDDNLNWVLPLGAIVVLLGILGTIAYSTDGEAFQSSRGYVREQTDRVMKELAEIKTLLKERDED